MASGRQSTEWDRACAIMATTINQHRRKGDRAIQPNEIHPMKRKKRSNFDSETIRDYAAALKAREEASSSDV